MKVFLDVGAHIGQTLKAALRWDFDRIVCFEPVSTNWPALNTLADKRTEIKHYGLWDKDAATPLYNAGTQGASFWKRPGRPTNSELCKFQRVSTWLDANVAPNDTVWMKLNVEGAELDVVTDLLDTDAIALIDYLEVMWDAGKIPEIADRVAAVRARLEAYDGPPRIVSSKNVPTADTCTGRVDNWIKMTSAKMLK